MMANANRFDANLANGNTPPSQQQTPTRSPQTPPGRAAAQKGFRDPLFTDFFLKLDPPMKKGRRYLFTFSFDHGFHLTSTAAPFT